MTLILVPASILISLGLVAAGVLLGGFGGGFLAGAGVTLVVVSVLTALIQFIVRRRIRNASDQLAGMLGPQGKVLLEKFSGR